MRMLFLQHLMRLVSLLDENSWRNRKLENGIKEKKTLRGFKMSD